jgi:Uma2 family endonuclease
MATTEKARITAAQFLAMDLGEGLFELVRGEIVPVSPPEYLHGMICGKIYMILMGFGQRTGHGHAGTNDSAVVLAEDTVRGPDICYFSEARWPEAQVGHGPPPVPPDLVVEVVSPGDRRGEIQEKVEEYLGAGIAMVWVVHPDKKTLTIHRPGEAAARTLRDSEAVEGLPELPDFRCTVAQFFPTGPTARPAG